MSNATDNLIEAEKMIRNNIIGSVEQSRTIEICKLLFLNNNNENDWRIKCYTTDDHKVRFCIDRGNDCSEDKIRTSFLNINPNFQIGILSSDAKKSYFTRHDKNWCIINAPMSRELSDKDIYEDIVDSYHERMQKMRMKVDGKMLFNVLGSSTITHPPLIGVNPTRGDVEKILREIAPKGKEIDEEVLKRRIEFAFALEKRTLKLGWWEETKKNLVEWSKRG